MTIEPLTSSLSNPFAGLGITDTSLNSGVGPVEAFAKELDAQQQAQRTKQEDEVREAAQMLVAETFIKPMLKELRDSALNSTWMDGGFAEDAWQERMDELLADEMTQSQTFPLVERVYDWVMAAGQPSRTTGTAEAHAGLKGVDLNG